MGEWLAPWRSDLLVTCAQEKQPHTCQKLSPPLGLPLTALTFLNPLSRCLKKLNKLLGHSSDKICMNTSSQRLLETGQDKVLVTSPLASLTPAEQAHMTTSHS